MKSATILPLIAAGSEELLSIIATFVGLICFCAVFTILYLSYVKSSTVQLETGKRDIELIDMALNERSEKTKQKRKRMAIVKNVLFALFLVIVIPVFAVLLINRFTTKPVLGFSFMVVATPSMSEMNEANVGYLTENELYNQFDANDVIFLKSAKSAEDIKMYDVIAYYNPEKGINIIHRVVSIIGEGDNTRFVTRGDANNMDDDYKPTFDNVVGVYTGKKIAAVGLFVKFLQAAPGIITIAAMLYCLIMIDFVSRKVEKIEQKRLDQLLAAIDSDEQNAKSMRAEFKEIIYYKGYAYRFDENGFVEKSEISDGVSTEEDTMLKVIDDGDSQSSQKIQIETRKNDEKRKDK